MGTKYIIEVEDKPFELLSEDGFTSEKLFRVKGFNSLVFDWNGLNMLTPYTEPDLEQIRKGAYEEGYKKCLSLNNFGHLCVSCDKYEQGLADAWEAVRKIYDISHEDRLEIFPEASTFVVADICDRYSASEAIEKIRQYEQEQEEQIQVGDEVISPDGKGVVTEINERIVRIMYSNGSGYVTQLEELIRTGRHFPEIAAVLEKMREEQDG